MDETISRTSPMTVEQVDQKTPPCLSKETERQGRGTLISLSRKRVFEAAYAALEGPLFHGIWHWSLFHRLFTFSQNDQEQLKYDNEGKGFLLFNSLQTV